jgi:hypothetical protein
VFTDLGPAEQLEPALYVSHFGSCPDAARFRKP